jgi:PPM family protein phosphatase
LLCFLADGQGGRSGGADAARIACGTAAELAIQRPPHALSQPASWPGILREADRAVLANPNAGFTTLLGFCIAKNLLVGASSGDSAVMAFSDHQPPLDVTRAQIKNPPVGSGAAELAPFFVPLAGPWLVLAMSDGVWNYVGWEHLVQTASGSRGEQLLELLKGFARLPRSGEFPDDFTLVALEDRP